MSARNYLLNGDFDVWQDRTSYTGITGATTMRVSDMTCFAVIEQGTWFVTKTDDAPSFEQAGRIIGASLTAVCTTADSSVETGNQIQIRQLVEGYDYASLFSRPQTFSFWVKSSTPGTYAIAFRNDGLDRAYVQTFQIADAHVWEQKAFTITAIPEPSGGWNFTNGEGLRIQLVLAAGPNYQGTSGVWNNANKLSTSAQTNLAATAGNYMRTTGWTLTDASQTGGVIREPRAVRLAALQRYFRKSYAQDTETGSVSDAGRIEAIANGSAYRHYVPFGVPMRVSPNVTPYSPNTGASGVWRDANASLDVPCFPSAQSNNGVSFVLPDSTDGNIITGHFVADARL